MLALLWVYVRKCLFMYVHMYVCTYVCVYVCRYVRARQTLNPD
jgi:hypothetical protein